MWRKVKNCCSWLVFQIKKLARRNNPESDGAASCRVSNRQRSLKKTKDGKCKFIWYLKPTLQAFSWGTRALATSSPGRFSLALEVGRPTPKATEPPWGRGWSSRFRLDCCPVSLSAQKQHLKLHEYATTQSFINRFTYWFTVKAPVSDQIKCVCSVVAHGRWLLTRIDPQGVASQNRPGHIWNLGENSLYAFSKLWYVQFHVQHQTYIALS